MQSQSDLTLPYFNKCNVSSGKLIDIPLHGNDQYIYTLKIKKRSFLLVES